MAVTEKCLITKHYNGNCTLHTYTFTAFPLFQSDISPIVITRSQSVYFKPLPPQATVTGKRMMTAESALQLLSAFESYFVSRDPREVTLIPLRRVQ